MEIQHNKTQRQKELNDRVFDTISAKFGFPPKDWQMEAMTSILSETDIVISAGTGSGKSLAFQGPSACIQKGQIIIVVAPLNSLMSNHVCICQVYSNKSYIHKHPYTFT